MCLYPRFIKNRKYTITKKNAGVVPRMEDPRVAYVAIGCGNCIECRRQKANEWKTRMLEEFKENPKGKFVTLTFSDESLESLCKETGLEECNAVAGKAIRRFLERIRKETKKSIHHWLITELGHTESERIHLHGILWTDKEKEWIEQKWQYGHIWVGDYCNEKTINYIVKYVTKVDNDHKDYKAQIFCSAGIGKRYTGTINAGLNRYRGRETRETYRLNNGCEISLPIYYRNKIYTEDEREKLWIHRLDKAQRYVMGEKFKADTEQGLQEMDRFLEQMQAYNKRLGYGSDEQEWKAKDYNITMRMLKKMKDQEEKKAAYLASQGGGKRKRRDF